MERCSDRDFGWALMDMLGGRLVRRASWPAGTRIGEHNGRLFCFVLADTQTPWSPSQKDILAEDWERA